VVSSKKNAGRVRTKPVGVPFLIAHSGQL